MQKQSECQKLTSDNSIIFLNGFFKLHDYTFVLCNWWLIELSWVKCLCFW